MVSQAGRPVGETVHYESCTSRFNGAKEKSMIDSIAVYQPTNHILQVRMVVALDDSTYLRVASLPADAASRGMTKRHTYIWSRCSTTLESTTASLVIVKSPRSSQSLLDGIR